MSQDTFRKSIFILLVILIVALFTQSMWQTKTVQAEDKPHNMRTLIENLKQKLTKGGDFTVSFQFNSPIIELDPSSKSWDFPYLILNPDKSVNPDVQRSIGEVGDDYVCFDELMGQGFDTRCVPFSGIANISYSDF